MFHRAFPSNLQEYSYYLTYDHVRKQYPELQEFANDQFDGYVRLLLIKIEAEVDNGIPYEETSVYARMRDWYYGKHPLNSSE